MIATSGTARIAVDDRGEGPATPALLIHAGVTDKRSWAPLIELLSPHRRCIAYDARGFGETTATPEDVSLTGDAIAVLDACGVDHAVVIGASMGGRTAIDLALARPEPAWPRLEQIDCPTLVIVGSLDLDDVRHNAHALADRVPEARFVELAGTAHLPHMETDPTCRELVADFLVTRATGRNQS